MINLYRLTQANFIFAKSFENVTKAEVHFVNKSAFACLHHKSFKRRNSASQTTQFISHSLHSDQEVAKFSKLASKWWNKNGEMMPLHSMNQVRVPFIRDNLLLQGLGTPYTAKPLQGISILDVGCGAGILSESLARLGATVVGIDPSEEIIFAAKQHRNADPDLFELQYLDSGLEDLVAVGSLQYDCVVASEVVEHCVDVDQFIHSCVKLLKPGGSIFVSTINRTTLSYIFTIVIAEKVLGVVPDGTHEWNKFVSSDELAALLTQNDCRLRKTLGYGYNPFTNRWSWSDNHQVHYITHALKADAVDEKVE